MAKIRTTIPQKTKALLQQEINSNCPICNDRNVDHFEIHHIDENPQNNAFENLLMLCPICHSKITKKDLEYDDIKSIKEYLKVKSKLLQNENKSNVINITGPIKGSTIANSISAQTIIIKGSKPKIELADGAIGKTPLLKNYIKHLIDRYNEFKEYEVGKGKLNYPAIYAAIKKEFKASVFQISDNRFDDVALYLQKRIDNTKLGRMNGGKGIKNYSLFDE